MKTQSFRFHGGVARVVAWHGRPDVASVALRCRGSLEAAVVERLIDRLRESGFREVVTNAVAPAAGTALVDAGFTVRERLHLLVHDLEVIPTPPPGTAPSRRARRTDRDAVLAIDASAFHEFWRLDEAGLREAARATPSAHTRVLEGPDGDVAGYALFGRAEHDGFVQRLAVRPSAQGLGLGRALLVDGLSWLRRRDARRVLVNTQEHNERALTLYTETGFRRLPVGLCVLGRTL